MAIRPEGQILVDFSALRAGFSTHIQWREGDTAQPNIHIQWSAYPELQTRALRTHQAAPLIIMKGYSARLLYSIPTST